MINLELTNGERLLLLELVNSENNKLKTIFNLKKKLSKNNKENYQVGDKVSIKRMSWDHKNKECIIDRIDDSLGYTRYVLRPIKNRDLPIF